MFAGAFQSTEEQPSPGPGPLCRLGCRRWSLTFVTNTGCSKSARKVLGAYWPLFGMEKQKQIAAQPLGRLAARPGMSGRGHRPRAARRRRASVTFLLKSRRATQNCQDGRIKLRFAHDSNDTNVDTEAGAEQNGWRACKSLPSVEKPARRLNGPHPVSVRRDYGAKSGADV
jgi:hypothetical protein